MAEYILCEEYEVKKKRILAGMLALGVLVISLERT
jgi:hypothetical protein